MSVARSASAAVSQRITDAEE